MEDGLPDRRHGYLIPAALLIWLLLNLLTLTVFPALHSDEAWLSGLSMEMIRQGRPDVTEPFFDLYPRHPHALKLVYHFLQIPFLLAGGYHSFPVRLLSLCCALLCLPLFHGLLKDLEGKNPASSAAMTTTVLVAADIQFITAAHTGRQEILLLLAQLLVLRLYLRIGNARCALFTGMAAGLAVGIHPNAFITAWPPGLLLLLDVLSRRRRPAEGLLFLLGGALGASVFVSLSFLFNPNFVPDYLAYGTPLGVTRGMDEKLLQLPRFFFQLFRRIAGTYYLPDIRLQMLLFPFVLILPLISSLKRRTGSARRRIEGRNRGLLLRTRSSLTALEDRMILCGAAGILAGIVITGKYSQPSVLFFLPFLYLGLHRGLRILPQRIGAILSGLTALALLLLSLQNIGGELFPPGERESYREFRTALSGAVGDEGRILGGLNTAYAFEHGRLSDYRNLPLLKDSGRTLESYIREGGIAYIILPEELDFVYRSRPVWNALYGNPSPWYPLLRDFTAESCEEIARIASPSYGTRIQAYRYEREWPLKVYRVLPASESSE